MVPKRFPVCPGSAGALVSYNPSSLSSTGLPELGPELGCGSLHLLPSLDEGSMMTIRVVTNLIRVLEPSPLLLGVLAGVILVGSWEFPLTQLFQKGARNPNPSPQA